MYWNYAKNRNQGLLYRLLTHFIPNRIVSLHYRLSVFSHLYVYNSFSADPLTHGQIINIRLFMHCLLRYSRSLVIMTCLSTVTDEKTQGAFDETLLGLFMSFDRYFASNKR